MRKEKGISLISLIITIIIIIILATIVIFSGLSSLESAKFARYCSEIADFNEAVSHHYNSIVQKNSLEGTYRTDEQIYYKIATKEDVEMNGKVTATGEITEGKIKVEDSTIDLLPEKIYGTEYYEITDDQNVLNWGNTIKYYAPTEKHYVTNKGEVFILPGYRYETNGEERWYVNARQYYVGEGSKVPSVDTSESGGNLVALKDKVKVGDYVNYKEYINGNTSYQTNTENTGYSSQTLNQEKDKDWRVLYVDSNTGEVLITTDGIVNSGTYLQGAKGYFNGAGELNNICKKLYSSTKLGVEARSMTVEDLNKACNYTPAATTDANRYAFYPYSARTQSGVTTYKKVKHYNGIYPNGRFLKDVIDGGGTKEGTDDGYKYVEAGSDNPVYVTNTWYSYNPSSKGTNGSKVGEILGSFFGWLASPCVDVGSFSDGTYRAHFGMRNAFSSYVSSGTLYRSDFGVCSGSCGVRPVVSLSSSIQVDVSDTLKNGQTSSTAWQLVKN